MQQTRQKKLARLLQKELGDIFLAVAKQHQGTLISVSEVRVSPDLSIAHAYLSIFPDARAQEMLTIVEDNIRTIRFELGNRVRHQLRIIPELRFHHDKTIDYLENIDNLLNQ
ncbi:MAG: 30S ribosome-binding factor RbfA [Paludibacteraceae bacterium]|nr:30S ribosome-binding factor RbfA [Paludibacteraceae bacterium]